MSRLKSLQYYVVLRLLLAPLQVFTIATIVFLLLRATPGDPITALLGPRVPESVRNQLKDQLGLNKPLLQQYFDYIGDLLQLNLGSSLTSQGTSVWEIIQSFFPATAELAIFSMIFALVIGVLAGMLSSARPGSGLDVGGRLFGIITYAIPLFWLGMLLQLLFHVQLGWFPVGSRFPATALPPDGPTGLYTLDSLLAGDWSSFWISVHHLVLPCVSLGIVLSGIFERIVRVNLRQTLQSDYVEAARARGIPERRVLVVHAFRNALIPVVTVFGLTFAAMLGGAVLTEVTFSWEGLGGELFKAIKGRDYPTVQGIIVFFSIIIVMASIAIDLVNAYIDPRIRY
ncbi:ABC transporter permease [Lyngbya confervoides]|uniref:ABC transporter permease n=1 Tax=Lyngbya confervoides BDU141951 TaxID=1574623 RepID=A0ABD4SYX4_9CYAN|nr:ABC transporter permease [Lyngbya confervoides]MCM1981499.1 ABC transporter permease [Lyngbya confervoides BDU141951]